MVKASAAVTTTAAAGTMFARLVSSTTRRVGTVESEVQMLTPVTTTATAGVSAERPVPSTGFSQPTEETTTMSLSTGWSATAAVTEGNDGMCGLPSVRGASVQTAAPLIRAIGVQTVASAEGDEEESSSDLDSTTPGANWPEWSEPSSADVWAMVQAMPAAGAVQIAAAARRRYRLRSDHADRPSEGRNSSLRQRSNNG